MLQVNPQVPAVQVAVALAGAVQTVPQAPQLVTSVCSSTQALPQRLKPELQTKLQVPLEHTGLALAGAVQMVPHVPQLWMSVCVLTHAPVQRV